MGFWKKVEHWATHPFGDAHNAKQFVQQAANTTNRADKALAGLYGGIITGGISTEMGLFDEGVRDFTKDVVKRKYRVRLPAKSARVRNNWVRLSAKLLRQLVCLIKENHRIIVP